MTWFKNKQATSVGWNLKKLWVKYEPFLKKKRKAHLMLPGGWVATAFLEGLDLP